MWRGYVLVTLEDNMEAENYYYNSALAVVYISRGQWRKINPTFISMFIILYLEYAIVRIQLDNTMVKDKKKCI